MWVLKTDSNNLHCDGDLHVRLAYLFYFASYGMSVYRFRFGIASEIVFFLHFVGRWSVRCV